MTEIDAAPPRLGVVVVNYGSHALLERNLLPADLDADTTRVLVVDNYVDDRERDAVTALCDRAGWQLVASDANPGFGAGVNAGLRALRDSCDTFLLLNPDCIVDAATARALDGHCRQEPLDLVTPGA